MNICCECNSNKGRLNNKLNIYLCTTCCKLDKFELIVKKYAKEKYLLKDPDFAHIIGYAGKCGKFNATYYKVTDIKDYICRSNFICIEDLDAFLHAKQTEIDECREKRQKKIEENKVKNKIKSEEKRNKRKAILVTALKNAGLELRNDSMLCLDYINDQCDYELDDVVKRMCQMKYLFEYCNMQECKQIAYENQMEERRAGYFPDCSVSEEAEMIALRKYSNGKYPTVFPWQNN